MNRPPPPDAPHLTARELACRRGTRKLFHGLELDVAPGQIVWIRGRNGRGKTSLLRLAAGLAPPEHGELLREGVPVRRSDTHERELVYIGHANALKEDLSAAEALSFLLRVHGRPHARDTVEAALERLGIASRRNALVRTLSQGQRRRIALARLAVDVAMPAPSLWLLDEPYDALDTDGVQALDAIFTEHLGRGGSLMLTSHLPVSRALAPAEVDLDAYV
ncbi:MAG TPA: cytochrome c biogenesis heme-transporting ATPase CcmA [Albitalea sp.]